MEQMGMRMDVESAITDWEDDQKDAVHQMIDEYGDPDEVTGNHIFWYNRGPWKRITAHKMRASHRFPMPHMDFLEQTINYQVPPDMADELAKFDGSILFDRTRGEMSARCHQEAMNLLALNLADDIVQGKRSVEDARVEYGRTAMSQMMGEKPDYTQRLMFAVPTETADRDEMVIAESAWETIKEKMRKIA
ncbi:MAG: hypothetical protein C4521_03180 [Actinobacteria bacterium]|nr:MAG: hypothetical protein C4521_03180 [Actinomycetota bacterium]